ncbi:phenazine biosynthesis FMN-dependent oxidase PhzG [Streptomyces sp. NPDC058657]|uniref:phenazine biosynthesis FMN-dependent oxidase PhzG n=1 Tax=unclassified Streptomyces TaxID=2593676 RepID=UPI00364EBD07
MSRPLTAPGGPAERADSLMHSSRYESLTADTEADFPQYAYPPAEPLALARSWLDEAVERGVREPRSLALATADAQGRASTRIVTVGALDGRGLLFTSHSTSRKGRELAANPWASGVLYWRETSQQIVLSGPTECTGDEENDALWAARPAPLHPMTAASHQSAPVDDVPALRERALRLGRDGLPLPRPARFTGYLLRPAEVEFWCARPDRLHQRLRYVREHDGAGWRAERLQP